jgi:hypothetical protein
MEVYMKKLELCILICALLLFRLDIADVVFSRDDILGEQ